MAKYRIVAETNATILTEKIIEAASLQEALTQAQEEDWRHGSEDGWTEFDRPDGLCELREELSGPIDDGQEG